LKKNRAQREKKNRVRREKNDRARYEKANRVRQLQKSHQTTDDELLKRHNALKKEIARRATFLRELKIKSQKRLRQSNEQFFQFSQFFVCYAIILSYAKKMKKLKFR
jgi:hypothetical protein